MTKLFSVCDDLAFLISRFYLQKVYLISIVGQVLTFASEIVIIYIHHPTKKTIKVWVGKSDSVIVWNEVTLRKVDTICSSIMLMGQFEGCITVILSILVTIQDIYTCVCLCDFHLLLSRIMVEIKMWLMDGCIFIYHKICVGTVNSLSDDISKQNTH